MQQVIDPQPLPDPNNIRLLSTHFNVPDNFVTESTKPTSSVNSRIIHHYIVEDYLFTSPQGEQWLPLVAMSHPSCTLHHWFRIYECWQGQGWVVNP
jgi:hypothetical protein